MGDPDCWYLFSDGLADDGAKCLEWVEEQQATGRPVPPIHTVGKHDKSIRLRTLGTLSGLSFEFCRFDSMADY
jgi:hypothetical protein